MTNVKINDIGLRIPENSFLWHYITYVNSCTDAYPEYHYTNGLMLLSTVIGRSRYMLFKHTTVYPNLWFFNLGNSSTSRKSTSIIKMRLIGNTLITPTNNENTTNYFERHLLPEDYSPEALIEELSENAHRVFIRDEAVGFLSLMERSYMQGVKDFLNYLYDCPGYYARKLRSGQRNKQTLFEIENAFFNILFATTPENFINHTQEVDLTSGWLFRFLFVNPYYEKLNSDWSDKSEEEEQDENIHITAIQSYFQSIPLTDHRMIILPNVLERFNHWIREKEKMIEKDHDIILDSVLSRYEHYCMKLSMLFALNRNHLENTINDDDLDNAMLLIDKIFLPTFSELLRDLREKLEENKYIKIEKLIEKYQPVTSSKLLPLLKGLIKRIELDEILTTMEDNDTIVSEIEYISQKKVYSVNHKV